MWFANVKNALVLVLSQIKILFLRNLKLKMASMILCFIHQENVIPSIIELNFNKVTKWLNIIYKWNTMADQLNEWIIVS